MIFGQDGANYGWIENPKEVDHVLMALEGQGLDPLFASAASHLLVGDDDAPVFFWDAEERLLGRRLGSWNQGKVGTCFPGETRIRMADGSHRRIDQVRLNDMVLTGEGNVGRVTQLWGRREGECLIRFKCHGHYGLAATAEHPIRTKRGYVRLDRLRVGDYVAIPRYVPQSVRYVATASHRSWVTQLRTEAAIGRLATFNGAVQFGRRVAVVQIAPVPDFIKLTPNVGRILGLFLAEGNTDRNKVVWTFHRDEKETLAAELVGLLKSEWDAEAHIQERGKAQTCRVNLYGRAWSELFASLCGNGAGLKRLHPDLAGGSLDFLRALWQGWLDGDGYQEHGYVQGTTVSHELALNMYDIANALGLMPAIRHCDPKASGGVRRRLRRYDVVVATGEGKNRPPHDERHLWRKVVSVVAEPYHGDVFNMEVEGDNSYVAEGIGTHNCVSFGYGRGAQDLLLLEVAAGQPEEWPGDEVATEPIYAGSRIEVGGGGISGDGSVGAWAAKWVKDWGILLRRVYGAHDLTTYSESRSRDWGQRGCPNDLEPLAREHPVRGVALVASGDELWAALGARKPVPVCSNRGFTTTLRDGFCEPSGSWAHCMIFRGRFTHPSRGKCVVIQNSWGRYLQGEAAVEVAGRGRVELPEGCFATTLDVAHGMVRQKDSFALDDLGGWQRRKISWYI